MARLRFKIPKATEQDRVAIPGDVAPDRAVASDLKTTVKEDLFDTEKDAFAEGSAMVAKANQYMGPWIYDEAEKKWSSETSTLTIHIED